MSADERILTVEMLEDLKRQIEEHTPLTPTLADVEQWLTARAPVPRRGVTRRGVTPGGIEWRSYR